jgi:hypothetical protein
MSDLSERMEVPIEADHEIVPLLAERGFVETRDYYGRGWAGVRPVPGGARLEVFWPDGTPGVAWLFTSAREAAQYVERWIIPVPRIFEGPFRFSFDHYAVKGWRWDAEAGGWVERDLTKARGGERV